MSLNSLAVRVPHNISRRVLQFHGPNPLAGIGFTTLCFRKLHPCIETLNSRNLGFAKDSLKASFDRGPYVKDSLKASFDRGP